MYDLRCKLSTKKNVLHKNKFFRHNRERKAEKMLEKILFFLISLCFQIVCFNQYEDLNNFHGLLFVLCLIKIHK